MRYEGSIYRPPSEAYSLLIQVTIGCSHNTCTFCTMFKDKKFRVRPIEEVLEDLEMARRTYPVVEKIFLCDGDALCLSNEKLMQILSRISELFPECKRVSVYGKSDAELKQLLDAGMEMIYMGAESGSQKVLDKIHKDVTVQEQIDAVKKAENIGIKTSVTFISGLAGLEGWEDHAIATGKMITEMNASYASLLTLMLDPAAPIMKDIQSGEMTLLTPEQIVGETYLLLEHAMPKKSCVFRSNHASNYISLRGNLPEDRQRMLAKLKVAMENTGLLKDERFRML